MPFIDPSLGLKLVFILGVINIAGLLLVFFSCRCLMGRKFAERLWKHGFYKKFYNYHCYFWWIFMISVLLHTAVAFLTFGIPVY